MERHAILTQVAKSLLRAHQKSKLFRIHVLRNRVKEQRVFDVRRLLGLILVLFLVLILGLVVQVLAFGTVPGEEAPQSLALLSAVGAGVARLALGGPASPRTLRLRVLIRNFARLALVAHLAFGVTINCLQRGTSYEWFVHRELKGSAITSSERGRGRGSGASERGELAAGRTDAGSFALFDKVYSGK